LKFEHVSLSFDGVSAIEDLSFEVCQGEARIILGAAGSGKTYCSKRLLGLQQPDAGSVYLFGQKQLQA